MKNTKVRLLILGLLIVAVALVLTCGSQIPSQGDFVSPQGETSANHSDPTPYTIWASDYVPGGEGVGFHDTTPGNSAINKCNDEDTDLVKTFFNGQRVCALSRTVGGEWTKHRVDVPESGLHKIRFFVSSEDSENKYLHIENGSGENITGQVTFKSTCLNWHCWEEVVVSANLDAGGDLWKLFRDSTRVDVVAIQVERVEEAPTPTPTPSPTPTPTPAPTPSPTPTPTPEPNDCTIEVSVDGSDPYELNFKGNMSPEGSVRITLKDSTGETSTSLRFSRCESFSR